MDSKLWHFILKYVVSRGLHFLQRDEINNTFKGNREPKITKNLLRQKGKMKYQSFLYLSFQGEGPS
jgi:hypothetical protein